jgi:transglycosylase-like protein
MLRPRAAFALVVAALLVVVTGLVIVRGMAAALAGDRLRRTAAAHGLEAHWRDLGVTRAGHLHIRGLVLTRMMARGDTVLVADSLGVALDPRALATLRLDVGAVRLAHAHLRLRGAAAEPDTVAPPEAVPPAEATARSERLRRAATTLVHDLLLPARRLPRLELRDVTVESGSGESLWRGARIAWLALTPRGAGVDLAASGGVGLERPVPFDLALHYGRDDRLRGGARFGLPDSAGIVSETLRVSMDGALSQNRRARTLTLADSTRVWIGRLPFRVGGLLAERGPRASLDVSAAGLTAPAIVASLPRAVLGPLTGLAVTGSFDWRLAVDLDLAHPDSVDFDADVTPHGLTLDVTYSSLDLARLSGPFIAAIHLPRDRIVYRMLSDANPFYRPLDRIDPVLVHAVLTNEDASFFHHRGFNAEAIRLATAENLKAGGYRRGAGTITMQLARNLWLGHRRTLSRKGQEVVLAWVLEHLTGLSKERLLEIYLNIIEWGPGVHGAAEAMQFYFGADATHVTPEQALFLTTLVPSPSRWRGRFAPDGTLRRWTRAQMHFIGRAMVAHGWLDPGQLPPADSLHVELGGPARGLLLPRTPADTTRADSSGVEARRIAP